MHHCSLVHQGPLFLHSTAYGRHLSLRHHRSLTHHCSLVQSGPLLHSLLLTGITAHSCTGAPLTLSTTDRHHCSLLNFPSEESACILHWSSRSRLHLCLILGSLPCPFFGQCPDRAWEHQSSNPAFPMHACLSTSLHSVASYTFYPRHSKTAWGSVVAVQPGTHACLPYQYPSIFLLSPTIQGRAWENGIA